MRKQTIERPLRMLVVVLIILATGPEILAGAELIALVDLLGVFNFLLLCAYGLRFTAEEILRRLRRWLHWLEPYPLFVPSWRVSKAMPGMLVHALPAGTLSVLSGLAMLGILAVNGVRVL